MLMIIPLLATACQQAQSTAIESEAAAALTGTRTSYAEPQLLKLSDKPSDARLVRSLLNVPRRMTYGEYAWDTNGIPAGPLWLLVDLERQTMSVFRGQHEIGTTVLLYGMDGKPTPVGHHRIQAKQADYWSRTYDAAMPYALRLTDDGVAIHGSEVEPGAATHGCLGVPVDFARKLFEMAKVGDEVVVIRGGATS
jgi:lipoprotein-anchoring transpeptidase ErfK/SrfK